MVMFTNATKRGIFRPYGTRGLV